MEGGKSDSSLPGPKSIAEIDQAIAEQEKAASSVEGGGNKYTDLFMLGRLLMQRFELGGNIQDVNKAIAAYKQSLSASTSDTDKASVLHCLGVALMCRSDGADIDAAAVALVESSKLTPPDIISQQPWRLIALGNALVLRFKLREELKDLNQAIERLEAAEKVIPAKHQRRADLLTALGISLSLRFEKSGNKNDIDRAIAVQTEAVGCTEGGTEMATRLSNLSDSLSTRFQHSQPGARSTDDIKDAIKYLRQTLELTATSTTHTRHGDLNDLGHALISLFQEDGDLEHITDAIGYLKEAIKLVPNDHPGQRVYFTNLASAYSVRFDRRAELGDLDQAIKNYKQSIKVDSSPVSDVNKPLRHNALGNAYLRRYDWLRELEDIDKALEAQTQANQLADTKHPHKYAITSGLGNAYLRRYGHSANAKDILKAIEWQESSIDLISDEHPDKPMQLNNLGSSLVMYFEQLQKKDGTPGNPEDVISKAVKSHEHAVHLTPESHTKAPARHNNYGTSLSRRFELLEDVKDINEAIDQHKQAIKLIPEDHPDRPTFFSGLGAAYTRRFEHAQKKQNDAGVKDDIKEAINSYRTAAVAITGSPTIRFIAARHWADLARRYGDDSLKSALEGYEATVNLVGRVVWVGKSVEQRYKDIELVGTSVNEAAAVACQAKEYTKALEWLEQGRSVVWGQILHLRTPLDDLRKVNPTLADRLEAVAHELENSGSTTDIEGVNTEQAEASLEEAAQAHRKLAEEWERLVTEARTIPGFERFLLPQNFSTLQAAAKNGSVVMVNIDKFRCDALIIKTGATMVENIHLDKLSYKEARDKHSSMLDALASGGVSLRGPVPASQVRVSIPVVFTQVLEMLWKSVAQPVLSYLNCLTETDGLSHLTWCLTGPLAFLPLHAAGVYTPMDSNDKIFNFVISTYTPSLTALLPLVSRDNSLQSGNLNSLLAITQSATPGQSPLPGVKGEVDKVEEVERKSGTKIMRLDDKKATVAAVIEQMDKHPFIHMACHAIQRRGEPTKSGFLLEDGTLYLREIMKKAVKQGELAFLSACQTASGDSKLPEESVHLGAGMLLAGFRSVIATMWSIRDEDAPLIAEIIYTFLKEEREDKGCRSCALHLGTNKLREKVGIENFLSWVPFIHIGA